MKRKLDDAQEQLPPTKKQKIDDKSQNVDHPLPLLAIGDVEQFKTLLKKNKFTKSQLSETVSNIIKKKDPKQIDSVQPNDTAISILIREHRDNLSLIALALKRHVLDNDVTTLYNLFQTHNSKGVSVDLIDAVYCHITSGSDLPSRRDLLDTIRTETEISVNSNINNDQITVTLPFADGCNGISYCENKDVIQNFEGWLKTMTHLNFTCGYAENNDGSDSYKSIEVDFDGITDQKSRYVYDILKPNVSDCLEDDNLCKRYERTIITNKEITNNVNTLFNVVLKAKESEQKNVKKIVSEYLQSMHLVI